MTPSARALFAILIGAVIVTSSWGQRGIPLPRFRPPVRVPIVPITPVPRVPIVPGSPTHLPGAPTSSERAAQVGLAADSQEDRGKFDFPIALAVIAGILASLVGLGVIVSVWSNRTVAHLRIVQTPPGEAPEEIRRAWVGAELPLRRHEIEPGAHMSEGILSRNGLVTATGYSVDGRAAIKVLASHAPEAAAWWRKNAPHVLERGYRFLFSPEVCERAD